MPDEIEWTDEDEEAADRAWETIRAQIANQTPSTQTAPDAPDEARARATTEPPSA